MNRNYPAYPQYSERPIEWVDSLPSTWNSIKLRWGASIFAGGTPSKTTDAFWQNGTIPWLNSGSVNQGLITEASALITEGALKSSSARWIKRKSLLVALAGQGKTKGMVAQLDFDATCNQSMAAIVPFKMLQPRFLLWWLSNNYQNIRNMAGGDLRDGLNLKLLGDIECPLPSRIEQAQIAEFLDYETAKIDALVEKQQQLIALLKEKRQAVISHAVTKGLNPDAPMRDSGVEWLGEIPAHWEVQRLKHICEGMIAGPFGSSLTKDRYTTAGVRVYGQEQVIPGDFSVGDYYISESYASELKRYRVRPKDLLISCVGTFGKVAVVPDDAERGIINPRLIRARLLSRVVPDYLAEVLRSTVIARQFDVLSRGGTMGVINIGILSEIVIALPPRVEQKAMLSGLHEQLSKLDRLIENAEVAVELIQERRTALISAVVTGKIDVRDWQPPETDKEAEVA